MRRISGFEDDDGVADLSLDMERLRVLQEREFKRLGGGDTVRVDVRMVAATNRDLSEEVREGRFRDDLYYRLNVFPIRVPPLRERLEDIAPLVARLAARQAERLGKKVERIDKKSLRLLESYDWPETIKPFSCVGPGRMRCFSRQSPQIRNEEGNRLLRKSAAVARPVSSRRLPLWEKMRV